MMMRFPPNVSSPCRRSVGATHLLPFLLLAAILALAFSPGSAAAQETKRVDDTFYFKVGVGLSDYTGDFPEQNTGFAYDFQEFQTGNGFPFLFSGELGYQFSPKWGLALGFQGGNYPIAGFSGPTIDDSYRYTPQILARYTFADADQMVAPYIDGGANLTFGGDDPPTDIGYGPTFGVGVDFALTKSTQFFVESRFNLTFPDDAIDGKKNISDGQLRPVSVNPANEGLSEPQGSFLGGSDSVNQLLGFGVKYNFSTQTAPRVIAVDGPTTVQAGESATFTAQTNEAEATRPLTYRWNFGDGSSGTGLTAPHTYNRAGTYDVTFTASNEAGEDSRTRTIEVTPAPEPARIASVDASPNPVEENESVRFRSDAEGDAPLTYEWDFGDGTSGTGEAPTHTYEAPGTYTARLTVSNEAGEDTRTLQVHVDRVLPEICTTVSDFNSAFFDRNSSTLTEEGETALDENVEVLSQCPNLTARIEGFAAPGERNAQELSEARARAVADYYEDRGIEADRTEISGEGSVEDVTTKKGDMRQHRRADTLPVRDNDATGEATDRSRDASPAETVGASPAGSSTASSSGGWALVVASMSEPAHAEKMAQRYRDRFSSESYPVDILSKRSEQSSQYRVVVGTFETADAARRAYQEHANLFPSETWRLKR